MNDMTDIPSFQPKPFVFVLMPFAPEFDDIYRYGIKEACEKAETYSITNDSDDTAVLLLNEPIQLLPGAFSVLKFSLLIPHNILQDRKYTLPMSVHIFLESGPEEYPFAVKVYR